MTSPVMQILLKNGTLLLHSDDGHINPTISDLLVEGPSIRTIAKNISAPANATIIDCTDRIISPGFVDTHHHLYESQLKGRHANQTLLEYLGPGNFIASLYTPEDLFWGQLAGCLEAIDAGTTTVVDHSTCNLSPRYPSAALQASATSGLRSIYCFTPPRRIKSFNPLDMTDEMLEEATVLSFRALAKHAPYADGRITIGFATDSIFLPPDVLKPYFADLRDDAKGRAHIITTHGVSTFPFVRFEYNAKWLLSTSLALGWRAHDEQCSVRCSGPLRHVPSRARHLDITFELSARR